MTGNGHPWPDHYEVELRPREDATWTVVTVPWGGRAGTPLRFASLRTGRDYADRHAARGPRIVLVDERGGRRVVG